MSSNALRRGGISYISDVEQDARLRDVDSTECRPPSVVRARRTAGVQDIQPVLEGVPADVSMPEEHYIALELLRVGFQAFEPALDPDGVSVSRKEPVSVRQRKNRIFGAQTANIAVSADVEHLLDEIGVLDDEAVELAFSVAEMDEPVSVAVADKNRRKSTVVAVSVRDNDDTHSTPPKERVVESTNIIQLFTHKCKPEFSETQEGHMNSSNKIDPDKLSGLLNVVSKKIGVPADKLRSELEAGKFDSALSAMSGSDAAKFRQAVNNPQLVEKMMSSPQAKALYKKLSSGK